MKTQLPKKDCPYCALIFQPKREWQRFCSTTCSGRYHNEQRADRQKAVTRELEQLRQKLQGT